MTSTLQTEEKFSRILLKLSGEALAQDNDDLVQEIMTIISEVLSPTATDEQFKQLAARISLTLAKRRMGLNYETLLFLATEVVELRKKYNTEVAIVIGGGNFWRGAKGAMSGMNRVRADYMGMLATVINSLAFKDTLQRLDQDTRVQSAIKMDEVCEPVIIDRAKRHLEKGRVVIFAAGTGHAYFTTDTTAILRAIEVDAQVVCAGKNDIEGLYTADPKLDPNATLIDETTHMFAIMNELGAFDTTAHSLAHDNGLPVIAYDLMGHGNLEKIILRQPVGTLLTAA
ncbi:uridine monophosphate kinase [Candidatus Saccharibacteria bacterium]|nr:uridine monophosphate kinase [Candidatus Saccharibacteria bacterium]